MTTIRDLNENIPFACQGDMYEIKRGLRHRKRVIQKFTGLRDFYGIKSLDVGMPNRFSSEMKVRDNTGLCDLNRDMVTPDAEYDVITCFEVLEHVMNPLGMMDDIYALLRPRGVCFLSTPVSRFGWYHSKAHFAEYKRDRLEKMFRYVGFEIVKYRTFCLWDPEFMFFGFRPLWRVLFTRNHLWELRKP